MPDLVVLLNDILRRVVMLAWGVFLLTWSIGWALRGAPIPIMRLKRSGQHMIEDAVWAAFWLSMGSTIFWIVSVVASSVAETIGGPRVNITVLR
ncbi:hypothetical protein Pyrfu_1644 [Pyrolobus fumarii 1A]|uniref:Uncharacterized protein n=1 Tax=Pyrolobus fumarii (strain DSM 11204 / 1A) TaxID=694429 RepID=G0ECD0_PYRF1|nr:DNA import protein CedA1 [Pyrolobus fumarii]AEM39500.1 hypothetical protein Pyrfu_1644 [Pyrolobus fumarii 1A]